MPIPKNEEEMRGEGWKKELTLKHIEIKNGVIFCQEYDFFAENFNCSIKQDKTKTTGPTCGNMHSWLKIVNGKLFWCCFKHRIANGPISLERGFRANEYIVSATDAVKICNDFGAEIPKELLGLYTDEKATAIGPKRRRPSNK